MVDLSTCNHSGNPSPIFHRPSARFLPDHQHLLRASSAQTTAEDNG